MSLESRLMKTDLFSDSMHLHATFDSLSAFAHELRCCVFHSKPQAVNHIQLLWKFPTNRLQDTVNCSSQGPFLIHVVQYSVRARHLRSLAWIPRIPKAQSLRVATNVLQAPQSALSARPQLADRNYVPFVCEVCISLLIFTSFA